ncbi:Tyrosine recombinase XerC [Paraburkholderia nemoris]|uniref:tyrosine-type recombinase/integrase n=1 Tax=Paraburkholderia nemoris TaxID=2793076 RepID=UPI001914B555|nr:tyrosine-type recombinase/integrase [Paraburkholderia nemoris]MBK5153637.1 tyrosine-type recombinase/integrase [Burkholderia sp. R-69608]CAE6972785.1 Tyrosine recombinase XerC [Paraburkholderia nemoris]
MTHLPSIDAASVERFLRAQRFRHPATYKNYAHILCNFNSFLANHGAITSPDVSLVQQWLKEHRLKWPTHILYHRTLLIERYVQWLHDQGRIASNPFAELHRQYGPRTTPIVRALVSEDSNAALQKQRRLPRFGSFLGIVMDEHIAHMRVLGYRYRTEEQRLLRFDRFLQYHPELAGLTLAELVEHWSEEEPSPYHLFEARRAGRTVSKAMHRIDPRVPILSIGDGVARSARQQERSPYIYTDEEIQRILQAALLYPSPKAPWRPVTLFTMLVLAYCAGLRGGEIARLVLGDVDRCELTIDIRETKFFKRRRLPLAPGVMAMLKHYLVLREQAGAPTNPESPLFWSPQRNCGYTVGGIRLVLTDVLRRAEIKPARGAVGPRIHDLRHTMVGHRMRDWYKSGVNPQSKLPYLATYLGHKDIRSTLVYLNITPELLQEAGERFRKNGATALQTRESML